jgi:hypothetical protein
MLLSIGFDPCLRSHRWSARLPAAMSPNRPTPDVALAVIKTVVVIHIGHIA